MTSSLTERYFEHYTPLVQRFVQAASGLSHPNIKLPEPFLPLFGKGYEHSSLRLVVVGQDTLGWGDLQEFLAAETQSPGTKLRQGLTYFDEHPFRQWGATRQRFWGFTMMLLAALHGQQDWHRMKAGHMHEILDGFAWANCNAIELYGSTAKGMGASADYWNAIREAGEHFNRLRHLIDVLRPHVVLIMYRGLNRAAYFDDCEIETVAQRGRLTHFFLPKEKVDVIHVPHPGSMNRIEGADYFCTTLNEVFRARGRTVAFPEFLNGQQEAREVIDHLRNQAPATGTGFDKFAFVSWLADELAKRGTFMSVPALAELLNERGEETNYGTEYTGGRGTYGLVRHAYHRQQRLKSPEGDAKAHNIAVAFRRPDFSYAYDTA